MAAKLDISGQMIDRLRWHALTAAEKAKRWKTRPRDTGGDRRMDMGLIRRGLLEGRIVEVMDGSETLASVGAVTDKGRAILKACRTKGPPKKTRDRER